MTNIHKTDVVVIGAGPVGLFSVFELGLLDLKCHLIDVLDKVGGQCSELYPEKPIYDIPAITSISGQQLTDNLMKQIKPFNPKFHLGQMATSIENVDTDEFNNNILQVRTDKNNIIDCHCVVIAAGGGLFTPKRPPIKNIELFENQSVLYKVNDINKFKNKKIIIAGGGDSALDWALNLCSLTKELTLIHRRNDFRAAPASINEMREKVKQKIINLEIAQIKEINGQHGNIENINICDKQKNTKNINCDYLLLFYGLTMNTKIVEMFDCELHNNLIKVNTEKT